MLQIDGNFSTLNPETLTPADVNGNRLGCDTNIMNCLQYSCDLSSMCCGQHQPRFINFIGAFSHFTDLVIYSHIWHNIENAEQVEKLLYYNGKCVLVKYLGKIYACNYNNVSSRDGFTGEPTRIDVVDLNRKVLIRNCKDFVLIKNNNLMIPTVFTVWNYCNKIADALNTIDVNMEQLQTPIVFTGSKEQKSSILRLYDKYKSKDIYWFLYRDNGIDVSTLNLNVKFVGKDAIDMVERFESKLLTYIGIHNADTKKEAGISPDETNANNQEVEATRCITDIIRDNAVSQCKELFGIDISYECLVDKLPKTGYIDKGGFENDTKNVD